jgi:hypothetical protein
VKRTFVRQLGEFPCPGLFFRSYTEVLYQQKFKITAHPTTPPPSPIELWKRKELASGVDPRNRGYCPDRQRRGWVLKEVYYDAGNSNKCFLVIDYQLQSFTGCINSPTKAFCTQLTHFLREHIGRSIKEIGDLHVSFSSSQLADLSKIKMYKWQAQGAEQA